VFWVLILFSGCCSVGHIEEQTSIPDVPIFLSPHPDKLRGAILFVHGLNLNPAAMLPLRNELVAIGYQSYQVVLTGHKALADNRTAFEANRWREDVLAGYRELRGRYPHLPIYILGYSLGGLLAVDVMLRHHDVNPAGLVLIAPAISLHTGIELASVLRLFPSLATTVPNRAPASHRRFSETPLFWYQNTMSLYWELSEGDEVTSRLSQVPGLVFLNPDDELVSFSGMKSWVNNRGLQGRWMVEIANPAPKLAQSPEHLMIDEGSMGKIEWQRMLRAIEEFFIAAPRLSSAYQPSPLCSPAWLAPLRELLAGHHGL
jgi:alpha-beta hydrolase superfamily lysophospholipase